jgi:hypothetical protein
LSTAFIWFAIINQNPDRARIRFADGRGVVIEIVTDLVFGKFNPGSGDSACQANECQ